MTDREKFLLLLVATAAGMILFAYVGFWVYVKATFNSRVYRHMIGRELDQDKVLAFKGDDIWFSGRLEIVIKANSGRWNKPSIHHRVTNPFMPPPLLLDHVRGTPLNGIEYYKNPRSKDAVFDDTRRYYYVPSKKIYYYSYMGAW